MILTKDNFKISRIGILGLQKEIQEMSLLLNPDFVKSKTDESMEIIRWLDETEKALYPNN